MTPNEIAAQDWVQRGEFAPIGSTQRKAWQAWKNEQANRLVEQMGRAHGVTTNFRRFAKKPE